MNGQRPRRSRSSITAEEILDAAEHIAAGGLDELTLRAVAARIDASPMALYRYFPTKDALTGALLDRVLGRVPAIAVSDDWIDDLAEFARAHAHVLRTHGWAVPGLFRTPDPGPGAAVTAEQAFAILARGGLTGADAVAAFSAIVALNYGWAAFANPDRSPAELRDGMLALPAASFAHTRAVAEELAEYADPGNYARALELVVEGIRRTATRPQ